MHYLFFFFFNDTATTEIYTLSLHDALPILDEREITGGEHNGLSECQHGSRVDIALERLPDLLETGRGPAVGREHGLLLVERSEEHTSELQSRQYLVCRLLLEKKKNYIRHEY